MQMRYSHNDHGIAVQAVDQTVREAGQQTAPQSRLELPAGQGVRNSPPNRPVQFIEKFPAKTISLFIIPSHGVIEFLPCRGKKTDIHQQRCLSMTS